MSGLLAVLLGVLRFVGAVVVGIVLLVVLALLASKAGLAHLLFPWGFLLVLGLALRFAITGRPTRFDRAAGAAAAGLGATGLVIVAIVASFALVIMAALWFLSLFAKAGSGMAGPNPVTGLLAPYALLADVVVLGAIAGAVGLVCAGVRTWSPAASPVRLGLALVVVAIAAVLVVNSW